MGRADTAMALLHVTIERRSNVSFPTQDRPTLACWRSGSRGDVSSTLSRKG
jgi:hypothetical protein